MEQETSKNKIKILAVVGPTASGKSALAVELAKRYGGEVVSCDSMQIYKHLCIATAKPTAQEMQGIPHHLIDFLEPTEAFSVAEYVRLAGEVIEDIAARGKLPIVCGGTGLYFSSLLHNITFSPAGSDAAYRRELEARAATEGAQALLDELREYDPLSAEKLHPNNLKRIIRAMEHYKLTGQTITEQNERSRRLPARYDALVFGITFADRQALYERINRRVDVMCKAGLIEEAKWYFAQENFATASAAIGYKELQPYFEGACDLPTALDSLKKETRHYAKRQLTWFKREEDICWLYADGQDVHSLAEQAAQEIQKREFLV
ncbi:MAG: tRNA (adenosine(37)-N6)-dimethylallyltransferase MiaA [Clostridia bacterium]|nr:tRNA (adenosine(37)-N6)-dimethylallyltransferase MiaA [Clostridia bacterium]